MNFYTADEHEGYRILPEGVPKVNSRAVAGFEGFEG